MCGIFVVEKPKSEELDKLVKSARKLDHRGPDHFESLQTDHFLICHNRLSIIDLHTGDQPIKGKSAVLVHNGEIYNHTEIRETFKDQVAFTTKSDSESILRLYELYGKRCLSFLDGVYSFVIVDGEKVFAARDPIGVKPLFYGLDKEGRVYFSSEQKALVDHCTVIEEVMPGTYYTKEEGFVRHYKPAWMETETASEDGSRIREALVKATRKRLMSDVPLGVLLSGGLDSSLVCSIVSREFKKLGLPLKSFSVGLSHDSKDLKRAREVAEFLGTEHHEVVYTVEEGIQKISELIYLAETYDVTSIRASTPMYIMSEYIRKQGVKVVLSGEGADEIFGGYLYFAHAPTSTEFHKECIRRIKRLYTADILRADRSTMGAGVEARVPFLDPEFLEVAMSVDPELKMIKPGERMEKMVLRDAFDTPEDPYLPDSVLWRQKEQFSDGVGYSWVDGLKDLAEKTVSDDEMEIASELFPINTPTTKEAFLYRRIFEDHFGTPEMSKNVKKWIPKWQDYNVDPSGRANKIHTATVETQSTEQEEDVTIEIASAI